MLFLFFCGERKGAAAAAENREEIMVNNGKLYSKSGYAEESGEGKDEDAAVAVRFFEVTLLRMTTKKNKNFGGLIP